jgi:low temperature requirement protein LtrA
MKLLRIPLPRSEQPVGWLELFFDLVYVATIIAIGNWFSHHLSLEGIAGFVLIFTIVWSSWVGTVFFLNRFDQGDVGTRLIIFVQMYFVVGLATHMSDPLGELPRGFALSFVLIILVRILMYGWAWRTYIEARPLIMRYILGDAPLALIWLGSVFMVPHLRPLVWVAGILWGITVPLLPQMRLWGERMRPDTHHLSERVGLFTIIVLGESFIKVVTSALGEEHQPFGFYGVFAMLVVASIWWVYFDQANSAKVREAPTARFTWFFAHLPLTIGVTAVGIAIKKMILIEPGHTLTDGVRWLLLGSLALCWLVMAFLELVTQRLTPSSRRWLVIGRILGVVVLLGIAFLTRALDIIWIMILAAAICIMMVAIDIFVRVNKSDNAKKF